MLDKTKNNAASFDILNANVAPKQNVIIKYLFQKRIVHKL